jgi:hypothetical protein
VRVVGDSTTVALQIVPTLRSVSGSITPGSTVVLEGTGLIEGGLTITIDGQTVVTKDVRNILDNDTLGFPNSVLDQQIVTLTVPAGVSAGVIQVLTGGGSFRMKPGGSTTTTTVSFAAEIGDTLATAQALAVANNNQLTVNGAGLNINTALDVDMYSFTANAGDVLNIEAVRLGGFQVIRLFNAAGTQLFVDSSISGPNSDAVMRNFIVLATGTYYLGISGYNNNTYDPNVAGSGNNSGNLGAYTLTIRREDALVTSITGITAVAASGTPAQAALPSANTGQTITLTGSGFTVSDQVVFETVDSSGRMTLTAGITPSTVAADGTSLTVVVPANTSTGMVRLARELVGRYLQIVPTISSADDTSSIYHGGNLHLIGTGIYEQGLAISYGAQILVDKSPFTGPDAVANTIVDSTVPEGVPTGPYRITTLGGTSAPFGSTFTSISSTAGSGTPANAGIASANPGQTITLNGTGLTTSTDVVFLVVDASGNVSERIVNPSTAAVNGTSLTIVVPQDSITGAVQIVGDQLNSALTLQIVPIITNVDLTSVSATSAAFRITGSGFVEDKNTVYHIGGVTVIDRGTTTGPDVFSTNTLSDITLPYSDSLFGAVSMTTAGGTSAPFTVGFTQLNSTAATGTPANAGSPSANPGQTLTLIGTGLKTSTDIVVKFYDDSGNVNVQNFNPTTAAADGTSATLAIPTNYNGAFPLLVIGSSFAPLLQIVPVVTSFDVNGVNTAQITGRGFVEANLTSYNFPGATIVDTAQGTGPDIVSSGTVGNLNLPVAGAGNFTITTAGGTSAPVAFNSISPVLAATVYDVAYSTATSELLVGTSGSGGLIYRINPTTGAQIGSYAIPVQNTSFLGLDIAPAGFSMHDTTSNTNVAVPTGSLIVFNGQPNPDRVVAMDPTTGAVLATLVLTGNFDVVGGAVTSTGRMFVLDPSADRVREINPTTGAEITTGSFAAGMDITSGDIAIHPTTGDIWIASAATTTLREYTIAGVFVRSIDVTPQGVSTELTGLAFRPNGGTFDVLASSNRGVVYVLPDPLVSLPSNTSATAGSTVTVPVNIDNGDSVLSATIRLTYDTDRLDVTSSGVHLGSLTGDGTLVANVDDSAGTIDITLNLSSPLGPGAGSLVEIDYQVDPTAVGSATLDLQSVILNGGALILTAQPIAGADSTDGLIAIQPPLRSSNAEDMMSFNPGEPGSTGTRGHQDGIGWEESWRDDADSIDSPGAFGYRRRKGASLPKGSAAPRMVATEIRPQSQIQWEEKTLDKSIRKTAIRDWIILN